MPVLSQTPTAAAVPLHRYKGAGVYQPELDEAVHAAADLVHSARPTAAHIGAPPRENPPPVGRPRPDLPGLDLTQAGQKVAAYTRGHGCLSCVAARTTRIARLRLDAEVLVGRPTGHGGTIDGGGGLGLRDLGCGILGRV